MGSVHDLLAMKGKAGALDLLARGRALGLDGGITRDVVEAASLYLSDDENSLGFAYSGWAQCALPHRRIGPEDRWEISSERVRLVVEPGLRPPPSGDGPMERVGVPFGSVARLILLFLQTQAIRTDSREVELGGSLRGWLTNIGASVGGSNARAVRDQAERISRCRLTFHIKGTGTVGLINQTIVDRALFVEEGAARDGGGRQGRLTLETAKLSEGFFEQLKKHPIPLEEAAVRAISNNAAALDAYLWLVYRLHVLRDDRLVTWKALKAQFGTGYRELYHFKPRFSQALGLAMAVYPGARVEVRDEGVVLKPSPSPVRPKLVALGRR